MQREIEKNINLLKSRIEQVSQNSEKSISEIGIIAVSKKKSLEHIKIAFNLGLKDFGENYAQELQKKSEELQNLKIIWHFIGPIQSNKIKTIARHANWIHSLDRNSIVDKLNRECKSLDKVINGCIQVNISEESSKSGIDSSELMSFANHVDSMENINLKGIMVLPKITGDSKEEMRKSKELHEELMSVYPNANYLSMGTTSDFESAIQFGSNLIRVGELIFGKRL
ncbi:MAG: YggS family pyridoxal phosphate-dependent enzyme [Gammaproteobacteria bacterium]|uniref:Pyridoxal phosphate homeostasis protein n=1 Tax=SAR86 cluster bacterium TaxID=2030880 RepID=A0A520MPZ0_9GAMM|nr:MAG: YggS family pyridoxal phosphate enzyme [Gammaproteobacteria bacterium TMED242]RZO23250.1 MAG: YggS family pyridoxal phosphate-dependent enzyme [SAR86 cluster bacterium]|tara:strand:- start:6553 stop:7230 length:678 start_codon:yes stop_codon:yes gene_type:complete